MNPYVFVVGCARSGNTLVQRLADAHPDLAVMHGTRWVPRWFDEGVGVDGEGRVTAELAERLPAHKRFKALELSVDELRALHREHVGAPYADFVRAIYDRFGERRGKELVGDKTPEYVQALPTLDRLFPRTRFVHVVRDGRDVCLSVADWGKGATGWATWGDDPVGTTAAWWELNVRLAREAALRLSRERYLELRYEAVVADPAAECARLCGFLGIRFDEAMLRFHEERERDDPRLDAKRAWRPVTAGLRSWREQMPARDVARFEAVAGGLLDELGYERGAGALPAEERSYGVRLRETLGARAIRRGRPVPAAWTGT